MTIEVNKEGPYYVTEGTPISFSSLRTNFKGMNSGEVSASQLKRDTSTESTDPTVPDATENVNISTSLNLKLSQFRNSIKKYKIRQSTVGGESAETDLDIDAQNWNSNLGKNIQKKFEVTGIIGATSIGSTSATLEADICNFEIDVSGYILGAGGITSGSKGGSALYVSNTTQRAVNNKIKININANGKIYSGGDAGTDGSAGNANSIECNSTNTTINVGYGADSNCVRANACNPGQNDAGCVGYFGANNCSNGSRRCFNQWWRTCVETVNGNVTSNGGSAGTFGVGRGYNNQATSLAGNGGNNATTVTCGNTQSTTTGNKGNDGNAGNEWGSGKAIFGNSYNITGSTITTVKGTTT